MWFLIYFSARLNVRVTIYLITRCLTKTAYDA